MDAILNDFQNLSLKKQNGQYFTKNKMLLCKILSFIQNNPSCILEPSVGRGDIVNFIQDKLDDKIKFDMYEIDESIVPLKTLKQRKSIIYEDFLEAKIDDNKKYDTIVGNPPYVKTKLGSSNLYIQFIEKCFSLLGNGGELIFIIPSDFFKLTSSKHLLNQMLKLGNFTHVFHPNDEKLFEEANIDVLIFRYQKTKQLTNKCYYNETLHFIENIDGMIVFNKSEPDISEMNTSKISDYFDVFVGMVSGKDSVFKNDKLGNITILTNEHKEEKFICIREFPCENQEINDYMKEHKHLLMNRKIRKFSEKNWFEWGALRNIKKVEENLKKKCIYVKNMTRNCKVAFLDDVKYFGGGLLIMIPNEKFMNSLSSSDTPEVSCEMALNKVVSYLNTESFRSNFIYSNRFKIGHRQLSNMNLSNIF
jgi:adenine-specific DNA-methyltransferase